MDPFFYFEDEDIEIEDKNDLQESEQDSTKACDLEPDSAHYVSCTSTNYNFY